MKYFNLPRLIVPRSQLALGEGSRARHSTCAWASRGGNWSANSMMFGIVVCICFCCSKCVYVLCVYIYIPMVYDLWLFLLDCGNWVALLAVI